MQGRRNKQEDKEEENKRKRKGGQKTKGLPLPPVYYRILYTVLFSDLKQKKGKEMLAVLCSSSDDTAAVCDPDTGAQVASLKNDAKAAEDRAATNESAAATLRQTLAEQREAHEKATNETAFILYFELTSALCRLWQIIQPSSSS